MTDDDAEAIRDLARFHYRRYRPEHEALSIEEQIIAIARKQGIKVLAVYVPDELWSRGVAFPFRGHDYIAYNSALPEEVRLLYLAHELGHRILEHNGDRSADAEVAASLYAVVLLRFFHSNLSGNVQPRPVGHPVLRAGGGG